MKKVAALGSCLSGLTAAMLTGDYRWPRVNNQGIARSDLFAKYFCRAERMPSREMVELILSVEPQYDGSRKALLDGMFRDSVGLTEQPAKTKPLLENLQNEQIDLFLLDNKNDTREVKWKYHSLNGQMDFEFNFPLHWCVKSGSTRSACQAMPCLTPAESAQHWVEIARYLHAVQPAARIVFLCSPSSTILSDEPRRARADAFEAALRAALDGTAVDIVPQLQVPAALSKLPADEEHLDMQVYRALAGWIFSTFLMQPAGPTPRNPVIRNAD